PGPGPRATRAVRGTVAAHPRPRAESPRPSWHTLYGRGRRGACVNPAGRGRARQARPPHGVVAVSARGEPPYTVTDAQALIAAAQAWSAVVLVAGLRLIGLVADDDELFAAAGYYLARAARRGSALFAGAVAMIGVVTAVLNLDTSVAFLTPVLVHAARSRGTR